MKVVIDISEDEYRALQDTAEYLSDLAWSEGWVRYNHNVKEMKPSFDIIGKIIDITGRTFMEEYRK